MITIKHDDAEIRRALNALIQAAGNLRPVLQGIGESLAQSTKQRFRDSEGPAGETWPRNTEATMTAYLGRFSGAKKGKRRDRIAGSKKPLIGETKSLATQIYYDLAADSAVAVGSPMEYAAMQQFGGTKAQFPHLWGDIPARPFLGVSEADRAAILDDLSDYFEQALG
jgi:phage virion morphogenesis protein